MPVPVLHIITRLAQGGAAENTIYTVNGLDPSRWKVDLAIGGHPDDDDQVGKLPIADHVEVHRIPPLVRNPSTGELRAVRQLRRVMRAGGHRIVHTHGSKAGILGRLAAHREQVPVIISGVHGHSFSPQMSPPARYLYRALERHAARWTSHFVSVGEDLRDQYLEAGVGRREQWSVIRSGMELDRFHAAADMSPGQRMAVREELGIPSTATVFTMVGRMEQRKGHRFFLEAAGMLMARRPERTAEPVFVIVGDGPEEHNLRAQAAASGIAGHTVFAGYRNDVERVISASDAVVLTSLWEGLPRVLVQAAATATPAISFACDGAHEIIADGENGWVVPMRDTAAVVERMGRLLADPELGRRMGKAGRVRVNQDWTVDAMIAETEALYDHAQVRTSHR